MLIYTNRTISRAPLLTERCGLRFEGAGRIWKGTRTIVETLDDGDPLGASRKDNTFRDFYFATPKLIFCDYRYFRKPSKHIVSTPTPPLPPNNHPSPAKNMSFRCPHPSSLTTTAAPYAVPSKLRQCDWSNALPPTPLAFMSLRACHPQRVYAGGDTI